MASVRTRYGASPLHLLIVGVSGVVAAYAVTRVPNLPTLGAIGLWFAFLLVAHDLVLFPLYAAIDNIGRRRRPAGTRPPLTRPPVTNHLRVPAVLSGTLLIAWFPLVLRLSPGYERISSRSIDPYLWRWLVITAVLYGASALLYVVRLRLASPSKFSVVRQPR